MRGIGVQSGRIRWRITESSVRNSASAVVGRSWKPATRRFGGRSMVSLSEAPPFNASLRELQQEAGPAGPGDRGGERPVGEDRIEQREREPGGEGIGELGGEAVAGSNPVEEVGQRDRGGDGLHPVR